MSDTPFILDTTTTGFGISVEFTERYEVCAAITGDFITTKDDATAYITYRASRPDQDSLAELNAWRINPQEIYVKTPRDTIFGRLAEMSVTVEHQAACEINLTLSNAVRLSKDTRIK